MVGKGRFCTDSSKTKFGPLVPAGKVEIDARKEAGFSQAKEPSRSHQA